MWDEKDRLAEDAAAKAKTSGEKKRSSVSRYEGLNAAEKSKHVVKVLSRSRLR